MSASTSTIAASPHESERYRRSDATKALALTERTMAVITVAGLAIEAQHEGATTFSSESLNRWAALATNTRTMIEAVRDDLVGKIGAPDVDSWVEPLTQLEAIDAAMWFALQTPDLSSER